MGKTRLADPRGPRTTPETQAWGRGGMKVPKGQSKGRADSHAAEALITQWLLHHSKMEVCRFTYVCIIVVWQVYHIDCQDQTPLNL